MFFDVKLYRRTGEEYSVSDATAVLCEGREYAKRIEERFIEMPRGNGRKIRSVAFIPGFPRSIKDRIGAVRKPTPCDEEYAIVVDSETKIYATGERGFLYAIETLIALARERGGLCRGFLYDYPICETRGYRVYLPARAGFEAFFKMIDQLAIYKYNSIILEIGGAMEYRRHPRINEVWADFCRDVHRYSGRAHEIQQKTYPWPKNSIHCDNAEGDILTQEECRTLAAYCRSCGLEVIPECPTLSHTDYLVMAYPHLREREGDLHPDTYCPLHPEVYKYVFDILEEVIDVFAPTRINIGHDEAYSIGVCPRCKEKAPHVLYANDIRVIRDFLAEKGIRTMMWGEKLLNARHIPGNGNPIGGAGHDKGDAHVPALYRSRDLIPRDVEMLHWYYVFNPAYDDVYHERGFRTYYGNLNAINVQNWETRIKAGIRGGFVSNWGSFGEEYMQRNQQYFALILTAYAFWCERYGQMTDEERLEITMEEAYRNRCAKLRAPIKVTHTTTHQIPYKCFYDGVFIEDSLYMLGHYRVTYSDGKVAELPVKYGENITSMYFEDYLHSAAYREVSYSTRPVRYRDGFAYETVYENPYPESAVVKIEYVPAPGKEAVSVQLLGFSMAQDVRSLKNGKRSYADAEFAWDGAPDEE